MKTYLLYTCPQCCHTWATKTEKPTKFCPACLEPVDTYNAGKPTTAGEIAQELSSGSTADVWYDADDYGDSKVAEEIEGYQYMMEFAAAILMMED